MGKSDRDRIAEFLSAPIADGEYRRAAEVHVERGRPPFALKREERNGNEIAREPQPPATSIPPADELVAKDGEQYERDVERVHHPPKHPGPGDIAGNLTAYRVSRSHPRAQRLNSVRPDSRLPADGFLARGSQCP